MNLIWRVERSCGLIFGARKYAREQKDFWLICHNGGGERSCLYFSSISQIYLNLYQHFSQNLNEYLHARFTVFNDTSIFASLEDLLHHYFLFSIGTVQTPYKNNPGHRFITTYTGADFDSVIYCLCILKIGMQVG